MDRRLALALFRLVFAALTVVAIVYQFVQLADAGTLVPLNFFSYFTIQSNLIAVAVFLVGRRALAVRPESSLGPCSRRRGRLHDRHARRVRAAAFRHRRRHRHTWVNNVVHQLLPIAVIADWLLDPPGRQIPFRDSLVWLVYPLAWTAYTLIRGPIADWYPYPFLDPANGGYGTVAGYVIGILIFGAVLCWVIATVGTMLGRRRGSAPAT